MTSFSQKKLLQQLPKVDEAISWVMEASAAQLPLTIVKKVVQKEISAERNAILAGVVTVLSSQSIWLERFQVAIKEKLEPCLKRVFNGTGVVIHTNLGRSLLPEKSLAMLQQAGGFYSNLEFNLLTGKRGSRYSLVEEIICELTGAEAALVVNNNAAAVLISLDTLARGREVIVSRGQLVEIGGSFRIPDVMAKSGAVLVEVGATNRTHIFDYENAITEQTAMLLRVHTSNFRIIGFTSEISAEEMVVLAGKNNLVTMEDLGSGSLVDFSQYGFPHEPIVQDIVKAGVDVVTFSGDKLLGGPQAGFIVGRKNIIERIKCNPLNRALRIDKFTLAGLETVLREYYDLEKALYTVPTLRMLTESADVVKKRGEALHDLLAVKLEGVAKLSLIAIHSRVGGGALPEHSIESWALAFSLMRQSVASFEIVLRQGVTPVVGRVEDNLFLLDMRTIQPEEIGELAAVLLEKLVGSEDEED